MAEDPVTHNIEVAQRIQERHEAYLLTLTFTLLGLSVQTARFGQSNPRDIIELVAWITLLISGLLGLSHAAWRPSLFGLHSHKSAAEEQARGLKKAMLQGVRSIHVLDESQDVPITESLERAQTTVEYLEKEAAKLERASLRKHRLQWYMFVLGIVLLIVSRGWQPLVAIRDAVMP